MSAQRSNDSTGDTGTRDITYDLVSVIYHSLQGAETTAMFIADAEQEKNEDCAQFFRETKQEYGATLELLLGLAVLPRDQAGVRASRRARKATAHRAPRQDAGQRRCRRQPVTHIDAKRKTLTTETQRHG